MSDPTYTSDPIGALVRDALYRFPHNRKDALSYIIRTGPATPEAAELLLSEAEEANNRPTSDGRTVGRQHSDGSLSRCF